MTTAEYINNLLQSYINEKEDLLNRISNNLSSIDELTSSLSSSQISDQEFKFFSPHDRDLSYIKKEKEQEKLIDELQDMISFYESRISELDLLISEIQDLSDSNTSESIVSEPESFDSLVDNNILSSIEKKYSLLISKLLKQNSNLYKSLELVSTFLYNDPYRSNIELQDVILKNKIYLSDLEKIALFSFEYSDFDSFSKFFDLLGQNYTNIHFDNSIDVTDFKYDSFYNIFYLIKEIYFILLNNDYSISNIMFHMKQLDNCFDIVIGTDSCIDDFTCDNIINYYISNLGSSLSFVCSDVSETEIHIIVPIYRGVKDGD